MKKRKGRIAQLLVMSVITLAMALSIYRNPEHPIFDSCLVK